MFTPWNSALRTSLGVFHRGSLLYALCEYSYVPSHQALHEPSSHLLPSQEPGPRQELGSFPSPFLRTPNFQQVFYAA